MTAVTLVGTVGYAGAMPTDESTPSIAHSGDVITLVDRRAGSSAVIAPWRGAIVTSFRVRGRELLYLDAATLADPAKNVRGGIPVLFPSPGKLEQDRWHSHGKAGAMKQHGFARNLPWSSASTPTDSVATLALEAAATTLAQYPWPFRTELEFNLAGANLRITARVHNIGTAQMPFGLGFHPYFLVTDKAAARIDTDATRAFDNVSKQTRPFAGFDLTAPEVDVHLLDHTRQSSTLHLGDGTRIEVRASPQFAQWVVWTLAGKDFVCLEPWTAPGNALNTGERLITLPAGEMRELWMELAFQE